MRAHRFLAAGFLVVAMLAVAVGSADAQTTAVGPYYATPSWDQKLPCSSASNCPRFIVLSNWNSEAVLDRETIIRAADDAGLALVGIDDRG